MNTNHYTGLTDSQVLESRAKYGVNILTQKEDESFWEQVKEVCSHWIIKTMAVLFVLAIVASALLAGSMGAGVWIMPGVVLVSTFMIVVIGYFGGFEDPLFKILLTAYILSMGISIYEYEWAGKEISCFFEPIGIIVALLVATGVAFFLEKKNEKTFQSLNEVNDDIPVKVIRNNNVTEVPRKDIVVGDIVLLEIGEEIPADCALLEAFNLNVNESSLTGEPQCYKTTDEAKFDKEATYPSNQIMKGTIVIEGNCVARVINVGDKTESGKVFESASVKDGDPTPLSEKLDHLADLITNTSYVFAALILIGRLIAYFFIADHHEFVWLDFVSYLLNTVMIAVTLIVVAVPEGLPMSVTLSLAFSMKKLMSENTLPRTMHACETMGATSVICTDKTGTLTQNKMQVAEAKLELNDEARIAEMIAVNSTANLDRTDAEKIKVVGNPTEGALLLWMESRKYNYLDIRERIAVADKLAFSTENKYMATIAVSAITGKKTLYVKGAPEIILNFCDGIDKKMYQEVLLGYQNKAMRTLALAYQEIDDNAGVFVDGKIGNVSLSLAGVFAISDPVREEVPDAIRSCTEAGIQIKIVTGDTSGTAKEIGRQIGLWTDSDGDNNIMTGPDFAAMSDEELKSRIADVKILSRARPNDKERLVKLLKSQDYVVAATGDGTNDAPALNMANVGLSMGDGTAVAKEASDMTIQDNSFSTISNAVMWGRSLYKNIQRFIMFQMTINVAACLIVLIGAFIGTESPLTVTQMLWVNLIMDTFAALALASLPPSKSVMRQKPRSVEESIISKQMAFSIFGVGGLFLALLMGILVYFQHNDITSLSELPVSWGDYNGLTPYELSLFFTIFVMLQFWNMFNAKAFMTGKSALANIADCKGFLLIALVIFVGQILIVQFGNGMFNVFPLTFVDWLIITAVTSLVLWIGEVKRMACK